jgi:hypothetical protein
MGSESMVSISYAGSRMPQANVEIHSTEAGQQPPSWPSPVPQHGRTSVHKTVSDVFQAVLYAGCAADSGADCGQSSKSRSSRHSRHNRIASLRARATFAFADPFFA